MELVYIAVLIFVQLFAYKTMPDANSFWIGISIIFAAGIVATRRTGNK